MSRIMLGSREISVEEEQKLGNRYHDYVVKKNKELAKEYYFLNCPLCQKPMEDCKFVWYCSCQNNKEPKDRLVILKRPLEHSEMLSTTYYSDEGYVEQHTLYKFLTKEDIEEQLSKHTYLDLSKTKFMDIQKDVNGKDTKIICITEFNNYLELAKVDHKKEDIFSNLHIEKFVSSLHDESTYNTIGNLRFWYKIHKI